MLANARSAFARSAFRSACIHRQRRLGPVVPSRSVPTV